MLRAVAAATAAFAAAAADEKGYPASHWEGDVDAMNAAARGRLLSATGATYITSALFPLFTPAVYPDTDSPGAYQYLHQQGFGVSVALSGSGDFFVVGQPSADLPFAAPPTPPFTANEQAGVVHLGKRSGTDLKVTQRDLTAVVSTELPLSGGRVPEFGKMLALSRDGETLVTSAPDLSKIYVFKKCRSENGCQLALTIADPSPSTTYYFGSRLALSPDATYLATSSSDFTKVYVYKLKGEGGPITVESPITVIPPLGFTLSTTSFGSGLKITSKGRRLIVGVPNNAPNDAILVYRREAGAYYATDTLYAPVTGLLTGFAEHDAIAVTEDSDGSDDESNDDFGARFTLVTGQQISETSMAGTASVWRCLKGLTNTCTLKTTIPASTSLGETGSIAASVAVSQRGEYVAVSGVALASSVLYGTVHIYKRAENAWTYKKDFATYVYGTGGASSGTYRGYPVAISRDGKVTFVGSGIENGGATLITRH